MSEPMEDDIRKKMDGNMYQCTDPHIYADKIDQPWL